MHDVLRQRILRKLETLPEEQMYQVLDYIEFLESKYARDLIKEASGLQKFAENLEDRLRKKAVNPANIREAFQLIAAADRVLSSVSQAGKELLDDLAPGQEGEDPERRPVSSGPAREPAPVGAGSESPAEGQELPPVGGGRPRPVARPAAPSTGTSGGTPPTPSTSASDTDSEGGDGPGTGGGA